MVYDRRECDEMKQKARVTWISLGNANTKYFSSVMKERKNNIFRKFSSLL